MRDDRSDRRVFQGGRRRISGEQVMGPQVVLAQRRCDRAHDRRVLHPRGQAGQKLAHLNAWHGGVDRLKRAADFLRRIGLEVERFQVARPAVEPDQDAMLRRRQRRRERPLWRSGICRRTFFGQRRLQPQKIGQSQPQCRQSADADKVAAANSVAADGVAVVHDSVASGLTTAGR
jgi:hypothetical protein